MRTLFTVFCLLALGIAPLASAADRKAELAAAVESVKQQIRAQWETPDPLSLPVGTKSVQVRLDFNPDGTVKSHNIVKSSGNEAIDASLMAAIIKAQPLSIPAVTGDPIAFMEFLFSLERGPTEVIPAPVAPVSGSMYRPRT